MPDLHPIAVVDQVRSALDVASLQGRVLASNIANRDSAGYVRMKAMFDSALHGPSTVDSDMASPSSPSPRLVPDRSDASLEADLLEMSKNTMNYQALARAVSRYLSITSLVANGGRN